jgi:thiol-disulfide isomerase/thioredoxin
MRTLRFAGLAVGCLLSLHLSAGLAQAQTTKARPADAVLTELNELKPPTIDPKDRKDQEKLAAYREEAAKFNARRAELAWELYQADPKNEQLNMMLPERWRNLNHEKKTDQVLEETTKVQKAQKGEALGSTAAFWYADAVGAKHGLDSKEYLKAADDFRKADPKNERGARLYMNLAEHYVDKDDTATAIKHYKKVTEYYPEARTGKMAAGKVKQIEGVGKPFALTFTDAITGKTVSSETLKGKVVVVDFWATWCGPCVAEMPHMKELYSEYKDRGVEFVGISLDNPEDKGGLKALKEYVEKNEVPWPQYYQGKGWEGEFSVSWGINSIPALFVVDKNGKLHSTNARGKLEEILPKLLGQS